jgi:hypothetical protein
MGFTDDAEGNVRIKSSKGPCIEMHGTVNYTIELMNSSVTLEFRLVSKKVDIKK